MPPSPQRPQFPPQKQSRLFLRPLTNLPTQTDSSPKASQGLYRYEGLVFVIVCIDTNREKLQYLEGSAMLRTAAILRKHYPGLPPTYHIRNRLVEKTFDDDTGVYRYATVYREKDIKRKSVD